MERAERTRVFCALAPEDAFHIPLLLDPYIPMPILLNSRRIGMSLKIQDNTTKNKTGKGAPGNPQKVQVRQQTLTP